MTSGQEKLNQDLHNAVGSRDLARVIELLGSGADVNCPHCTDGCRRTPLMEAASNKYVDIVKVLLDAGADRTLRDSDKKTAEDLARSYPETVDLLRNYIPNKDPDKIVFYDQIDQLVREDVYDFSRRERVTLIRQSKFGVVAGTAIIGFSAIEDQSETSQLRQAFNEHIKRGGKVDEAVVFPNRLPKIQLKR